MTVFVNVAHETYQASERGTPFPEAFIEHVLSGMQAMAGDALRSIISRSAEVASE